MYQYQNGEEFGLPQLLRVYNEIHYYFCYLIQMKSNQSSGLTKSDLYYMHSIRKGKTDHHQKQHVKASLTINTVMSVWELPGWIQKFWNIPSSNPTERLVVY